MDLRAVNRARSKTGLAAGGGFVSAFSPDAAGADERPGSGVGLLGPRIEKSAEVSSRLGTSVSRLLEVGAFDVPERCRVFDAGSGESQNAASAADGGGGRAFGPFGRVWVVALRFSNRSL
jgi:hypothetical protein